MLIQVYAKGPKSLRDQVVKDARLERFGLVVHEQKRKSRPRGWAKLHKSGSAGAINIEWHSASQTLICRVVTRGGEPHDIAGAFVSFLLARLAKQIVSIHIQPP